MEEVRAYIAIRPVGGWPGFGIGLEYLRNAMGAAAVFAL